MMVWVFVEQMFQIVSFIYCLSFYSVALKCKSRWCLEIVIFMLSSDGLATIEYKLVAIDWFNIKTTKIAAYIC